MAPFTKHIIDTYDSIDNQEYCEHCLVVPVDVNDKYCVDCAQDITDYLAQQYVEQVSVDKGWY